MIPKLHIIPFREFAEGMKDHWPGDPANTPVFNNPFSIIQYHSLKWPTDIIYIPVKLTLGDQVVAYTSIYNISDTMLRIRGVYVKPEFRGQGLGFQIIAKAMELFPKSFGTVVEFFSYYSAAPIFKGHGFKPTPELFWSRYSHSTLELLYYKRPGASPNVSDSRIFIRRNRERYSLGGKNNLDVNWSIHEWSEYFLKHKGQYATRVNPTLLQAIENEK